MKSKLKGHFLPPPYLQDNYYQLHNLSQGTMGVEEYTREYEKLLIKCDLQEAKNQTIVRYLRGLDRRYALVNELQQYTTFDEGCVCVSSQSRTTTEIQAPQKRLSQTST